MQTIRFRLIILLQLAILTGQAQQTFQELLTKGDEFYSARNYKEAIYYFTQAIGADPNNPKGYWYRGDTHREIKNYSESIRDYDIAINLDPNNAKYRRLRGDSYYDLKDFTRAEKDYSKAIELDPNSATTWLYRADCQVMLKANDKACEDYRKAHMLGSRSARPRAIKQNCEWVRHMVGNLPCHTADANITRVEMDPLNGAVLIDKELAYDGWDIATNAGAHISGPEFANGEVINLKLKNVRNFCSDIPGTIYMGAGYEIRENGGREVEKVHNIYPNDHTLSGEQAKNVNLQITFPSGLTKEKQYVLKAHFFDTKGNGEVFIEFPFKMTGKTLAANPYTIVRDKMEGDILIAGVGGTLAGMQLHHKKHGGLVGFHELETNSNYEITASEVKNLNKHSHLIFRFLDPNGTILLEHKGRSVYHGEHVKLDFSTEGIPAGDHTLWLKIQEIDAPQNIGIIIPVTVK